MASEKFSVETIPDSTAILLDIVNKVQLSAPLIEPISTSPAKITTILFTTN